MAQRRKVLGAPADFITRGAWPNGSPSKDAPTALAYAQHVSKRLSEILDGQNISQVALDVDVARSTLYAILAGRTWPDFVTLVKLERAFKVRLWPDSPL